MKSIAASTKMNWLYGGAILCAGGAVFVIATPYMSLATIAFGLMNLGLFNRAHPKEHALLMRTAIGLDLALVLTLAASRHAIETAISFSLSPLQQAHIGASSVATLLYFPILYLGWLGLRSKLSPNGRSWHIRLGITAYIFRGIGFILMFTLLGRPAA